MIEAREKNVRERAEELVEHLVDLVKTHGRVVSITIDAIQSGARRYCAGIEIPEDCFAKEWKLPPPRDARVITLANYRLFCKYNLLLETGREWDFSIRSREVRLRIYRDQKMADYGSLVTTVSVNV